MTTEVIENKPQDKVKVLHESVFWDESDPRWYLSGRTTKVNQPISTQFFQSVDMEHDSYIWAFTGTRGAGKSIAMTYYGAMAVYLWNKRIISNYPIRFVLKIGNKTKYVESEPLDMYKLLCFDKDYTSCLIIIDEAPDIISHMAAMTWKNRLLNIWIREIRKNNNSLFMGTQQLGLIDKSMRWQTDIVVKCQDLFRIYGSSEGLERGTCIDLKFYDHSGQWTGNAINADWDSQLDVTEPTDRLWLPGRVVWGAFDTLFQQDVFESLRKVDMKLSSYEVGDAQGKIDKSDAIQSAIPVCLQIANSNKPRVDSVEFFNQIGELTDAEKRYISKALRSSGVKFSRNNMTKDFTNFDPTKFGSFAE